MDDEQFSLFPDLEPVPVPDRLAGLGWDARRTVAQLDVLATGYNPGSRIPLHEQAATGRDGAGLRCAGCVHLYRTGAGNKRFLKCHVAGEHNSRGSWGPDMRAWWPACKLFEPREDSP